MKETSVIYPHQNDRELELPFTFNLSLLTDTAYSEVKEKRIPAFENFCEQIIDVIGSTPLSGSHPISALRFAAGLKSANLDNPADLNSVLCHKEPKHVLIQNDFLKVILIRWEPGAISSVHGHAEGGCIFKVLHGKIRERRYSVEESRQLLSQNEYYKNNVTYIDDTLGYHDVANTGPGVAITMHLYTPGETKNSPVARVN